MLDEKIQKELIQKGRSFMKAYTADDPYGEDFESDQSLKRPQPPLVKAAMRADGEKIMLPRDFDTLEMKNDTLALFRDRKSSRVYTGEEISLLQLSFLLWCTQGIKDIRGKSYATLRTVPCGGARHEFETYLVIRNVEGVEKGAYHYLPMEHAIERLPESCENWEERLGAMLSGQTWGAKASAVFFWSMVSYRAEWRYGIYAHRIALVDAGHVGQNLYLGCTALGLGTCAIGAFEHELCCDTFGLDGNDEFIIYTAPVGTVRAEDQAAEKAFYSFVEEEGL